jgi:5-methylcytosine-specific restriction endonuclease McrA
MADAIIAYEGPVVLRKQAKADGLTHYFQGSSCRKGHIAQRYTRNGECVICAADRQRVDVLKTRNRNARSRIKHIDAARERSRVYSVRRRIENPQKVRERERELNKANPGAAAAKQRRYRQANKEIVADRKRVYRELNPDHEANRARVKAWRIANPDAYIAQLHLRRSRKLGADGSYGPEDVQRMLHAQHGLCNGCACDIRLKYTVDHMMPLSRGGSNWPSNLQLLCKRCNSSKNNRTMAEWLAIKEKICHALQTKVSP